jgi:hypothetical protein
VPYRAPPSTPLPPTPFFHDLRTIRGLFDLAAVVIPPEHLCHLPYNIRQDVDSLRRILERNVKSPTQHILDTDRHFCLGGDTNLSAEVNGRRCEKILRSFLPLQQTYQIGDAATVPPGQMLLPANCRWNAKPGIPGDTRGTR